MKKLLVLITIVFALMSSSCDLFYQDVSGYLSEEPYIGSLLYTCSADKTYYSVSGTKNTSGEVAPLAMYEALPVTHIQQNAFQGNKNITSFTIPNSITFIGEGCFSGCTSLKRVIIPITVETIGTNAFSGCSSIEIFVEGYESTDWYSNWNGGATVHQKKGTNWHAISFDTQGGEAIAAMPVKNEENIYAKDLPTPKKSGSAFDYWYYKDGQIENKFDNDFVSATITSDKIMVAKWK